MVKELKIVRSVCDICGSTHDTEVGVYAKKKPTEQIALPMHKFDAAGKCLGLGVSTVDACKSCLATLEKELSKHYDMADISYMGVNIKHKGEKNEEKG